MTESSSQVEAVHIGRSSVVIFIMLMFHVLMMPELIWVNSIIMTLVFFISSELAMYKL